MQYAVYNTFACNNININKYYKYKYSLKKYL